MNVMDVSNCRVPFLMHFAALNWVNEYVYVCKEFLNFSRDG